MLENGKIRMQYFSSAEMEYIGTKCTKLLCSWTGRWCASYREDLKYLRKCGKPKRSNERKEDPITLLDVLKEQKASKYSGTLPNEFP